MNNIKVLLQYQGKIAHVFESAFAQEWLWSVHHLNWKKKKEKKTL